MKKQLHKQLLAFVVVTKEQISKKWEIKFYIIEFKMIKNNIKYQWYFTEIFIVVFSIFHVF